jgi:hypothetical protein
MDLLVAAATMESEVTLPATAPDSPIATIRASMETASPAGSKRASNGGQEAKPKAPKKFLSKEDTIIQAAKRCGRCKNLKEMNAAAAAVHQPHVAAQLA